MAFSESDVVDIVRMTCLAILGAVLSSRTQASGPTYKCLRDLQISKPDNTAATALLETILSLIQSSLALVVDNTSTESLDYK